MSVEIPIIITPYSDSQESEHHDEHIAASDPDYIPEPITTVDLKNVDLSHPLPIFREFNSGVISTVSLPPINVHVMPATPANVPAIQRNVPVGQLNAPMVPMNTHVARMNAPVYPMIRPITVTQMIRPVIQMNRPVSRMNGPLTRMNVPVTQMNGDMSRMNVPVTQINGFLNRMNVPVTRISVPLNQMNEPVSQMNEPSIRKNVPMSQGNLPVSQMNDRSTRMTAPRINMHTNPVNGLATKMPGPTPQMNRPVVQMDKPVTQINKPMAQMKRFVALMDEPVTQMDESVTQINESVAQINESVTQMDEPVTQVNVSQMNRSVTQMNRSVTEKDAFSDQQSLSSDESRHEENITRERASRKAKEQAKERIVATLDSSDSQEFACMSSDGSNNSEIAVSPTAVIALDRSDSDYEEKSPVKIRSPMASTSSVMETNTRATANTIDLTIDLTDTSVAEMSHSLPSQQRQAAFQAKVLNQRYPNNDDHEVEIDEQECEVVIHNFEPGDFVLHKDYENKRVDYPVWRISDKGDKLQKFEHVVMGNSVIHRSVSKKIRWSAEAKKDYKAIKVKPLLTGEGIETIRVLPEYQPTKNCAEPPVNQGNKFANKPQQNKADVLLEFLLHKEDEKKAKYPIWRQTADGGDLQRFDYVKMGGAKIIHKSTSTYHSCTEAEKQNFKHIKAKFLSKAGGIETVNVLPDYQPSSNSNIPEERDGSAAKRRKIMMEPNESVQFFLLHKKDEKANKKRYPIWRLCADNELQKFKCVDMGDDFIRTYVATYKTYPDDIKHNYKQIKVRILSDELGHMTVKVLPLST